MQEWEVRLEQLINSGVIGAYQYCKVDQIVLFNKDANVAWNYFTHVHFSSKYDTVAESALLASPATLQNGWKLIVSQYSMRKETFADCVRSALSTGIWSYTDSKITEGDRIDEAFPTPVKFIAENDPTGSYYSNVIPLEKSLYGSNFLGSYYVFEIYARGEHLKDLLRDKDVKDIQKIIHKCKLNYRLDELPDRIGNVVCKFEIETLRTTPKRLGEHGMVYSFELTPEIAHDMNLHLHIEQEHDRLLYEYVDESFCLHPGESIEKGVEPNQCKTTLTVSDAESRLILFRAVADRSVYSNYYGQITPDYIIATPIHQYRKVKVGGREYNVPLNGIKMVGEPPLLVEMADAGERQQKWQDAFFKEQNYLRVYNVGQHDEALCDIRSIINKQLLWDLDEIRIVDPYLSPNDILNTVALCEKPGIRVCCLTDIHTISHNKDAKADILTDGIQDAAFDEIRNSFQKELEDGLGQETDLRLSFRTVHGNNGSSFHDRYLILKYQRNKTRVWSLGTSVNSVGKSHHIIQIVESPMLIDTFFDEVWSQTNSDKCKIYDYSDYAAIPDQAEKESQAGLDSAVDKN